MLVGSIQRVPSGYHFKRPNALEPFEDSQQVGVNGNLLNKRVKQGKCFLEGCLGKTFFRLTVPVRPHY